MSDGHTHVEVFDLMEWAQWMEADGRQYSGNARGVRWDIVTGWALWKIGDD